MAPNAYNITILDQSPTVVYSPYRDGPLDSSWRVIYSNSPESSYDSSHNSTNLSSGTSLHSTTLSGASLRIDFKGTAIYLYGSGTANAYTTSMDGKDTSGTPSDDLLASYTGLDYTSHSFVLTTTQSSQLNFTSALLTVGIGEAGASINKTNIAAVNVASDGSSSLNSYFTTSGNGPFNTDHDATGYPRVDTTGDGSKIMFEFNSASALFVYGTANYDHDIYSVSLNPTAGVSISSRTFNDTSRWFAYDNLVYWETDLNRSLTYQVTFTNLAQDKYMDIHSVTLYDAVPGSSNSSGSGSGSGDKNGSSSDSSLSTGAIIGIAVGAAAALAVGFIFLFWWRRHLKKQQDIQPQYDYGTPMQGFHSNSPGFTTYSPHSQPLLSGYVEPFTLPESFNGGVGAAAVAGGASSYHSKYDSSRSTSFSDSAIPTLPSSTRLSYHLTQDGLHASSSEPGSSGGASTAGFAGAGAGTSRKSGPPPEPRPRQVRQETDAGPVPLVDHDDGQEDVLPPGYNPAWMAGER